MSAASERPKPCRLSAKEFREWVAIVKRLNPDPQAARWLARALAGRRHERPEDRTVAHVLRRLWR